MARLLGVGSALVDHLAHVPEAFVADVGGLKGGTELVDAAGMARLLSRLPSPPVRVPGGAAANTTVGAARLGVAAGFLSEVGDDEPGRFYRDSLARVGVAAEPVKVHPTLATGRCLCLITPDSQRTMRTHLGASSAMGPDDIRPEDFRGYTHAHLEGYLLFNEALLLRVLQTARTCGCTVSLDLAWVEAVLAARARLPEWLTSYVDTVFANEDEAAAFCGSRDEEAGLAALAACCEVAVVKLGARGALIRRGRQTVRVSAVPVRAVDTTGAGDLWAGGFLAGRLSGRDLEVSGRLAARVAAAVVQVVGASIPEAAWADLRQGW